MKAADEHVTGRPTCSTADSKRNGHRRHELWHLFCYFTDLQCQFVRRCQTETL